MVKLPESLQTISKFLTLFTIIVSHLNYLQFTFATLLNVYKPGLYLEISLHWQFKYIILLDLLAAAGLASTVWFLKNVMIIKKMAASLLLIDFLIQLFIIIDCKWGWWKMGKMMSSKIFPCNNNNIVAPADLVEIELSALHPPGDADGEGFSINSVSLTTSPDNIQVC